jgi:cytoskeletal protein CcmA (bactofilin family)
MVSFKKRHDLAYCPPSTEHFDTFIGNSTEIHGRLVVTGSLRVDGKIVGNLESPTDSNSSIALGRTGVIQGDVSAQRVLIGGLVEGNIYAKDKVTLHESAEVRGDVTYNQISIEHGAKINGLLIARDEDLAAKSNSANPAFAVDWEKIKGG